MPKKRNLKKRLIISYFSLTTVIIFLISLYVFGKIQNLIFDEKQSSVRQSAENTAEVLDLRMEELNRLNQQTAFHALTQKVFLKELDSFTREEQLSDYRELKAYLSMIEGVNRVHRMKLFIRDGLLYSRENTNFFPLIHLGDNPTFVNARSEGRETFRMIQTQNVSSEQVIEVLTSGMIIWNYNKTDYYGVIMAEIALGEIEELLDRNRISLDTILLLTDKNNHVLVQNRFSQSHIDLQGQSATTASLTEKGLTTNSYFSEEIFLTGGQLKIILLEPYSLFLNKIKGIRLETALFLFLISVLGFVLITILSEINTRKLHRLANKMEQAKQGNLTIAKQNYGNDELGYLEERFDNLIHSVNRMMDREKEQQQKLREGELQLLQSQINPHFLYNALDLIHWKILDMGDGEASRLVQALAHFYRLSLSGGMEMIPLGKEVEHVSNYLLIQNFRYENKIRFINLLDERFFQTPIPKVTLQPLMENAIIHGIQETGDRGGTITLECEVEGKDLLIRLKDDGAGMSEEQCRSLLDEDVSKHFATYNVNLRLKLSFGDGYGLTFSPNKPGGVCVLIRIPLKS